MPEPHQPSIEWPFHALLQVIMETRVCGSPAVDGYRHVNVSCILQSPTARWFRDYLAAGGRYEDMVVHIEQQADYDGGWGLQMQTSASCTCSMRHAAVGSAMATSSALRCTARATL